MLILALGEILWDMLPSGKQLGGAPANFAYHVSQLGARAVPVSAIGDDASGREVFERVGSMGLDNTHLAIDPHHPTGTVSVTLDAAGKPSYVIHENVAWDHIPVEPAVLDLAGHADCLCFGTLAQRSPRSRASIRTILGLSRRGSIRILDINFRQHYYDRTVVEFSLRLANVLKINDEELPRLFDLLAGGSAPRDLFWQFPNLRLIALTRGGEGSVLLSSDGQAVEHPGVVVEAMADTVGAGDAFTAALAVGLLKHRPLERINQAANRLAAYVCTQHGATPPIPEALRRELI